MSSLAPTLEAFFTQRLIDQRRCSPKTVASYRDAWRLLVNFAHRELSKAPSDLQVSDLDAPLIGAFLEYLERDRHNAVRTRNARLAAPGGVVLVVLDASPKVVRRVRVIPPPVLPTVASADKDPSG